MRNIISSFLVSTFLLFAIPAYASINCYTSDLTGYTNCNGSLDLNIPYQPAQTNIPPESFMLAVGPLPYSYFHYVPPPSQSFFNTSIGLAALGHFFYQRQQTKLLKEMLKEQELRNKILQEQLEAREKHGQ